MRHPETAGDFFLPAFAPDERARGVLGLWAVEQGAQRVLAVLVRDGQVPTQSKDAGTVDARHVVRALELADAAALMRLVDAQPKRATALPPGAWATIARRTTRTDAYVIAVEREPAVHALPLLDAAARSLPATEAARVLDAAAARPELASAAFQLRARVATDEAVLIDTLRDPSRGADAAAALARRGIGSVAAVGARLLAGADRVEQRNALLYLRLVGTPDALDAARAYAARPGADAALRREIASW